MFGLVLALAVAVLPPGYSWRAFNDGSGDYSLWQGETQVGHWQARDAAYYPRNPFTREWGPACPPPCPPPVPNYGLLPEPAPDREVWSRNGKEISRAEALAALDPAPPPAVPDDANANRLVCIGSPADCAQVVKAWDSDAALSPWRGKVVFQCFEPDEWQVCDAGFVTTGKPALYYLAPDGSVLHRQDDFDGGSASLAEALREADATYNPSLDTDRRNPLNGWLRGVKQIPDAALLLVAVGACVLVFLLLRK